MPLRPLNFYASDRNSFCSSLLCLLDGLTGDGGIDSLSFSLASTALVSPAAGFGSLDSGLTICWSGLYIDSLLPALFVFQPLDLELVYLVRFLLELEPQPLQVEDSNSLPSLNYLLGDDGCEFRRVGTCSFSVLLSNHRHMLYPRLALAHPCK